MRKVAFLVANDTFPEDQTIPSLRYTQNDATALKEVLEDPESCGFETKIYLNETSQTILVDLERISKELSKDDIILFYYSGHGRLSGKDLCLISRESRTTSLRATSIKAHEVLAYLQDSRARRRVLILDCCHAGAIGHVFKGGDAESALAGLAQGFGSYVLTASTAIQLAEEREKDGHGIFTKALIDCLREGSKESITVNDWYEYAYNHLKIVANQTPLKWGLQEEGAPVEIANFKLKRETERQRHREHLISTARARFAPHVNTGALDHEQVEVIMHLLESDKATLLPHEQTFRDKVIAYLNGENDFLEVFATPLFVNFTTKQKSDGGGYRLSDTDNAVQSISETDKRYIELIDKTVNNFSTNVWLMLAIIAIILLFVVIFVSDILSIRAILPFLSAIFSLIGLVCFFLTTFYFSRRNINHNSKKILFMRHTYTYIFVGFWFFMASRFITQNSSLQIEQSDPLVSISYFGITGSIIGLLVSILSIKYSNYSKISSLFYFASALASYNSFLFCAIVAYTHWYSLILYYFMKIHILLK